MSIIELSDEPRNITINRRPLTIRRTQENCGSSLIMLYKKDPMLEA